ncbi:MAG: hypothetical protein ABL952_12500 [Pyrinomonadaceae bacterium]
MKNIFITIAAFLFFASAAFGQEAVPTPESSPPAVVASVNDNTSIDLARATLAAHGGDRFIKIKTLVLRGTADLSTAGSTQTIPASFAIVISDVRYRFDIHSQAFSYRQIYHGQQSYSSIPGFSLPLDKMGLEMLRKINEKDYTVSALPEKFKKKKGFRITSPEGSYTDLIVDEKTNLVKEFESSYDVNGNTLTTSVSIDKYREVDGVLIYEKFSQRMETPQGMLYGNFMARDIQVNVEIGDDVFTMPK